MIKIKEVVSRKDLKTFIHLPFLIHKNHKEWLPPLIQDEWKVFDAKKNHSFEQCDTILLLAEKDGKTVGRVMGIINHSYNSGHNEKNARFCFAETFEDVEVYTSLLQSLEKWAKEKGMEKMVGPLGFSDKDPQGYLVEGFEDPMSVMVTNCSFPYMVDFTKKNGYTKKLDLFEYRMDIPSVIPEFYAKAAERVQTRGFKILEFNKSKNVRPYVKPVFDLINETYTDIYGFAPLQEIEAKEFSERFLPMLNADFIKIVADEEDKIVAFVVAMPDISQGFRKANGHLFPFGFIHILRSFKKAHQLNLLLGCVKDNIRNSGIDALMAVSLFESAKKAKLKVLDSHLIMEENTKMRALMERLDAIVYKKYRIYEKPL
ncbi:MULTISPECIES: hypothetical protein [unclassified Lentimicrobium]|uniref:hypothetical protein n=1 Tax=unclassified Lentimicrobium TaxID=2677434 RepID=UPI001554D0AD|nr:MULTISPECIES: hypothetical protein [unclassified Lentimicrobium]NPD45406.1 hypothetical protein [Lentimicrobium sp. S6]NPD84895.1 hypothetical protein [Lentimicrobium sp. L6]